MSTDPRTPSPFVAFGLNEQILDAMEVTLEHVGRAADRPMSWKWVIIGIRATLHGAFYVALRGSSGSQLLVDWQEAQTYERWARERANFAPEPIEYATKGGKQVEPKTDRFLELFAKVQDPPRCLPDSVEA